MFNSDLDRRTNAKSFHGFYRGEVVVVDDPMRAGRMRVKVFGVHDDFEDSALPWALYADPFMGGDAGHGGFFIPDVGSHVWVFFECGDPEMPVVFAGAPAKPDGPSERNVNYPHNHVYKTKSGHTIQLNDGSGQIIITSSSGTRITIQGDGDMEIDVNGNVTENVNGDYDIQVSGNYRVNASNIFLND